LENNGANSSIKLRNFSVAITSELIQYHCSDFATFPTHRMDKVELRGCLKSFEVKYYVNRLTMTSDHC